MKEDEEEEEAVEVLVSNDRGQSWVFSWGGC